MTVLKLAMANLVMWTRDRSFPATYARASLSPAVAILPLARTGRMGYRSGHRRAASRACRRLTCDLAKLCQQVEAARPRLPDGRTLVLLIAGGCRCTAGAGGLNRCLGCSILAARAIFTSASYAQAERKARKSSKAPLLPFLSSKIRAASCSWQAVVREQRSGAAAGLDPLRPLIAVAATRGARQLYLKQIQPKAQGIPSPPQIDVAPGV